MKDSNAPGNFHETSYGYGTRQKNVEYECDGGREEWVKEQAVNGNKGENSQGAKKEAFDRKLRRAQNQGWVGW